MTVYATYVSVWDGGGEIRTTCKFDDEDMTVFDIESSNIAGDSVDVLEDEFVELNDGTQLRSEDGVSFDY
jgi:hypothetical protein